jgi:hypothetical protein
MVRSNFEIASNISGDDLTIKDLGPWDKYMTVTNDAENVVAELFEEGYLQDGRRLFYYDSENELTELTHENGVFKGFKFVQSKV